MRGADGLPRGRHAARPATARRASSTTSSTSYSRCPPPRCCRCSTFARRRWSSPCTAPTSPATTRPFSACSARTGCCTRSPAGSGAARTASSYPRRVWAGRQGGRRQACATRWYRAGWISDGSGRGWRCAGSRTAWCAVWPWPGWSNGTAWTTSSMRSALLERGRYQLEIVGSGPYEAALRARVRRLGLESHVRFTGWLDQAEVARRHRAADLFTLAPRVESFGECVPRGTCLRACRSWGARPGGIPELIEHARHGLLVPPGRPRELAHAICYLAADPRLRQEIGRRSRADAERRHSWDRMTTRHLALYNGVRRHVLARRPLAELSHEQLVRPPVPGPSQPRIESSGPPAAQLSATAGVRRRPFALPGCRPHCLRASSDIDPAHHPPGARPTGSYRVGSRGHSCPDTRRPGYSRCGVAPRAPQGRACPRQGGPPADGCPECRARLTPRARGP